MRIKYFFLCHSELNGLVFDIGILWVPVSTCEYLQNPCTTGYLTCEYRSPMGRYLYKSRYWFLIQKYLWVRCRLTCRLTRGTPYPRTMLTTTRSPFPCYVTIWIHLPTWDCHLPPIWAPHLSVGKGMSPRSPRTTLTIACSPFPCYITIWIYPPTWNCHLLPIWPLHLSIGKCYKP